MKTLLLSLFCLFALAISAAAQTVVVTPTNTQGWFSDDTRPGGAISYVVDPSAPGPYGALQLTTDATNAAKAQYMHLAGTPLANVTQLSYSTYQQSASFAQGEASYQLATCLGGIDLAGNCVGFTTFVYEPYQNGAPIAGTWQTWDVDAGQFWSSRTYSDGSCTVSAGAGGAPFYTLSGIQTACPNAVVAKFGVNIGTYNPSYVVEADSVDFNGTTYDFEPYFVVSSAEQCKNNGWKDARRANLGTFKNQGDCIQYVNTGK